MGYFRLIGNRWNVFVASVEPLPREFDLTHWLINLSETGLPVEKMVFCTMFVYHALLKELFVAKGLRTNYAKTPNINWRLNRLVKDACYDPSAVPTLSNLPRVLPLVWRDLQEGLSEPISPLTRLFIPRGRKLVLSSIETSSPPNPGGVGTSKHKTMELFQTLAWIVFPIAIYQFQAKPLMSPRTSHLVRRVLEFTHGSQRHLLRDCVSANRNSMAGLGWEERYAQKSLLNANPMAFALSENLALEVESFGLDWQEDCLPELLAETTTTLVPFEGLDTTSLFRKQVTKVLRSLWPCEPIASRYRTHLPTHQRGNKAIPGLSSSGQVFTVVPDWRKHFVRATKSLPVSAIGPLCTRPVRGVDGDWKRMTEHTTCQFWNTLQGDWLQTPRSALGWKVSSSTLPSKNYSISAWIRKDWWTQTAFSFEWLGAKMYQSPWLAQSWLFQDAWQVHETEEPQRQDFALYGTGLTDIETVQELEEEDFALYDTELTDIEAVQELEEEEDFALRNPQSKDTKITNEAKTESLAIYENERRFINPVVEKVRQHSQKWGQFLAQKEFSLGAQNLYVKWLKAITKVYKEVLTRALYSYIVLVKTCVKAFMRGLNWCQAMGKACLKAMIHGTGEIRARVYRITSALNAADRAHKEIIAPKKHWSRARQECLNWNTKSQQWLEAFTNRKSERASKYRIPFITSAWTFGLPREKTHGNTGIFTQTVLNWATYYPYEGESGTWPQASFNTLLASPITQNKPEFTPTNLAGESYSLVSMSQNQHEIPGTRSFCERIGHHETTQLISLDQRAGLAQDDCVLTKQTLQSVAQSRRLAHQWAIRWHISALSKYDMHRTSLYEPTSLQSETWRISPKALQVSAPQTAMAPVHTHSSQTWRTARHAVRITLRRATPWTIAMLRTRRAAMSVALWKAVKSAARKVARHEVFWSTEATPVAREPVTLVSSASRAAWRTAKRAAIGKAIRSSTRNMVRPKAVLRAIRATARKMARHRVSWNTGAILAERREITPKTRRRLVSPAIPVSMQAVWAARIDEAQKMETPAAQQALQHATAQSTKHKDSSRVRLQPRSIAPFSISRDMTSSSKSRQVDHSKRLQASPRELIVLQQSDSQSGLGVVSNKFDNYTVDSLSPTIATDYAILMAPPKPERDRWIEVHVLPQVLVLFKHRNLMLTRAWWSMVAKLFRQAQPIVWQAISHTASRGLRSVIQLHLKHRYGIMARSSNQNVLLKQRTYPSQLRDTLESVSSKENPSESMWVPFGLIKLLSPIEYAALVWFGITWLLYGHHFASLSGMAQFALWNDLEKVRSTKEPSWGLHMQLLAYNQTWSDSQREDWQAYCAQNWPMRIRGAFLSTALGKWRVTAWLRDMPITDLFRQRRGIIVQSVLGEETLSLYRLPQHKTQIQVLAGAAWKDWIPHSSFLPENGLTYLKQWAETAYARPNWSQGQKGAPDGPGWVNLILHKVSVSSQDISSKPLRGRRIPLELSSLRARGILLLGTVDTGKTYLAKSLAAEGQMPLVHIAVARRVERLDPLLKLIKNRHGIEALWLRIGRLAGLLDLSRRLAPSIVWISDLDKLCLDMDLEKGRSEARCLFNVFLKSLNTSYLADLKKGVTFVGSSTYPAKLDPALVDLKGFQRVVHVRRPTCFERQSEFLSLLNRKQLRLGAIKLPGLQAFRQRTVGYTLRDLVALSQEVLLISIRRGTQLVDTGTLNLALSRQAWGVHSEFESTEQAPQVGIIPYKVGRAIVQRMLVDSNPMQPIRAGQDVWKTRFYYLTKVHLEPSSLTSSLTELTLLPHVLSCLAGTAARDAWSFATRRQRVQKDTLALDRQASHDLGLAASLLQALFFEFAGSDILYEAPCQETSSLSKWQTKPKAALFEQEYLTHTPNQRSDSEAGWIQPSSSTSTGIQAALNATRYDVSWSTKSWRLGLARNTVFDWQQKPDEPRFSIFTVPCYEEPQASQLAQAQDEQTPYEKSVVQPEQQEEPRLQAKLDRMLTEQRMELMDLPVQSQYLMEYETPYNSHVWLGKTPMWDPLATNRLGYRHFQVRDLLTNEEMFKNLSLVYGVKQRHKGPSPFKPMPASSPLGPTKDVTGMDTMDPKIKQLLAIKNRSRFATFRDLIEAVALLSGPQVLRPVAWDQGLTTQRSHEIIDGFSLLKAPTGQRAHDRISVDLFAYGALLESYCYLVRFFVSNRSLLNEAGKTLVKKGILY